MTISPLAGKPAPKEMLIDPARLEREYFGPPFVGLYLNPPSSGGLCEGVMTMPSARCSGRERL